MMTWSCIEVNASVRRMTFYETTLHDLSFGDAVEAIKLGFTHQFSVLVLAFTTVDVDFF